MHTEPIELLLLQQQQIITSLIDPVVFISLYIITAGIKDSDDRVISQPIACPQATQPLPEKEVNWYRRLLELSRDFFLVP